MRAVAAHEVAAAVRHGGQPLGDAVRAALARVDGAAGLIAVGAGRRARDRVQHRRCSTARSPDADGVRTAVAADWR